MILALFAADRLDTWVFAAAIAVPVVCLAGVVLWHLAVGLSRKMGGKRRPLRQSPEPPAPFEIAKRGRIAPDDPQRLEQHCAALVESLAAAYLELAESWLRQGESRQATTALQQLVRACPETPQAEIARERLRQVKAEEPYS
jgi:hypothetical protein